jgi:hypothetical protein
MRNTIKTALITGCMLLALFLAAGREASGEVGISYGLGYGFSNKNKAHDVETYDDYRNYFTRAMASGQDLRVRFSSGESRFGFSLDVYVQDYDETYVELYQGAELYRDRDGNKFVYIGGMVDYSFFPKKKLNPYVGIGLMQLLYIDLFGGGPPSFPATPAVKLAGGARYKLARWLNIDAIADYLPFNGIVSLRLGLELVL